MWTKQSNKFGAASASGINSLAIDSIKKLDSTEWMHTYALPYTEMRRYQWPTSWGFALTTLPQDTNPKSCVGKGGWCLTGLRICIQCTSYAYSSSVSLNHRWMFAWSHINDRVKQWVSAADGNDAKWDDSEYDFVGCKVHEIHYCPAGWSQPELSKMSMILDCLSLFSHVTRCWWLSCFFSLV